MKQEDREIAIKKVSNIFIEKGFDQIAHLAFKNKRAKTQEEVDKLIKKVEVVLNNEIKAKKIIIAVFELNFDFEKEK